MTDPRELYREHIVEHSQHPRNAGTLAGHTHAAHLSNPLCGDRVTVELVMDGAEIADVRFQTRGCAIAVAASSMMTVWVKGRTLAEIGALRIDVDRAVDPRGDPVAPPVAALMALRAFPTRQRCATLAWDALIAATEHPAIAD